MNSSILFLGTKFFIIMITWLALRITSEEEYNEITSVLYSADFTWQLGLRRLSYTELPNIKHLFIGKYKNQYVLEWSAFSFIHKTELLIFKEELQYIEQLKLMLE